MLYVLQRAVTIISKHFQKKPICSAASSALSLSLSLQTMHCASGSSSSNTVKLLLSLTPTSSSSATTAATGDGGKPVFFHLGEGWEDKGVDLGAIGRALGLDPASIRLNGYLLGTRRPDHIAASVRWGSLLAFFFARSLPTGRVGCGGSDPAADDPIIVQGRPASLLSDQKFSAFYFRYDYMNRCHREGVRRTNSKRKLASRDENALGKEKIGQYRFSSSVLEAGEDGVSASVLCMEKKLRLDDENPLEKRKKGERFSAKPSAHDPPAGFALNCVKGHRKRYREDDLVAALPCKRTV